MDLETVLQFVAENHQAVLATMRADGTPSLTPVTVGVDDDSHITISSRETAYKVRNLRRDPRLYLCVFTDQFFGEWVHVEGTAEIVDLPDAMDLLIDYYRRIRGEHPDWGAYRAAMVADQRVMIRVQIGRVGPNRQG